MLEIIGKGLLYYLSALCISIPVIIILTSANSICEQKRHNFNFVERILFILSIIIGVVILFVTYTH